MSNTVLIFYDASDEDDDIAQQYCDVVPLVGSEVTYDAGAGFDAEAGALRYVSGVVEKLTFEYRVSGACLVGVYLNPCTVDLVE